jgi:hypothetical protein
MHHRRTGILILLFFPYGNGTSSWCGCSFQIWPSGKEALPNIRRLKLKLNCPLEAALA